MLTLRLWRSPEPLCPNASPLTLRRCRPPWPVGGWSHLTRPRKTHTATMPRSQAGRSARDCTARPRRHPGGTNGRRHLGGALSSSHGLTPGRRVAKAQQAASEGSCWAFTPPFHPGRGQQPAKPGQAHICAADQRTQAREKAGNRPPLTGSRCAQPGDSPSCGWPRR